MTLDDFLTWHLRAEQLPNGTWTANISVTVLLDPEALSSPDAKTEITRKLYASADEFHKLIDAKISILDQQVLL